MTPAPVRAALTGAAALVVAPGTTRCATTSASTLCVPLSTTGVGAGAVVAWRPAVMNPGGLAWVNSVTNATGECSR